MKRSEQMKIAVGALAGEVRRRNVENVERFVEEVMSARDLRDNLRNLGWNPDGIAADYLVWVQQGWQTDVPWEQVDDDLQRKAEWHFARIVGAVKRSPFR